MYMHNGNEMFMWDINQKPEERGCLGDLDVDRRIMLKWINPVTGSFDHRSEPVCSLKS
jgi:hypothetical protein